MMEVQIVDQQEFVTQHGPHPKITLRYFGPKKIGGQSEKGLRENENKNDSTNTGLSASTQPEKR